MDIRNYNLAGRPRVNRTRSRWRILLFIILILTMTGVGIWRLDRFLTQQHSLRSEASAFRLRRDRAGDIIRESDKVIKAQQKIWQDRIDWANGLVGSTKPVLSSHLGQLETLLPEKVRLNTLKFERKDADTLALSLIAATNNDLFELYRRLAGFGLNVSGENALDDSTIRAELTVVFPGKQSEDG